MTPYRYPREHLVLVLTLVLVFAVIALTSAATLCSSGLFLLLILVIAFFTNRSHHNALINRAHPVTRQTEPALSHLVEACAVRLKAQGFKTFIVPGNVLNAYTFGMSSPRGVVLYSALFSVMDPDELRFIIGHELGHIRLGHTWLNTLLGGMAGIPSPFGAAIVLYFSFRWWNRLCEFSADRAGLLACGRLDKAISALVKLAAGINALRAGISLQEILRRIEAQDDALDDNLRSLLSSHPMTVRRIAELRQYAASAEYTRLQAQVNASNPL